MIYILAALAVWRLSFMLVMEDGPFQIFEKLRNRFEVYRNGDERVCLNDGVIGNILICLGCTSVWVSAGISLYLALMGLIIWPLFPVVWLTLSSVSILFEVVRNRLLY